jgi:uncharacterized protein
MKFTLDIAASANIIRAYAPGRINVNDRLLTAAFVISSTTMIENWSPQRSEDITLESLQAALGLEPEILVIGTGSTLRFLEARLTAEIQRRGIGLEVLDTAAACRTYNILVSENRKVVAALLMI